MAETAAAGAQPRGAKTPTKGIAAKRGRPTPARVAAIDDIILRVARTLFLEEGYADTSMDAVALSAGVSKGTLYARYPGKADLFRAIIADRIAVWSADDTMQAEKVGNGDVFHYLKLCGESFLAGMRNPEVAAFERLVVAESGRFPELAEQFSREGYYAAVDRLGTEIERRSSAEGLRIAEGRQTAIAFTSALIGWYRVESTMRALNSQDCAGFVDRLVAIFRDGRHAW